MGAARLTLALAAVLLLGAAVTSDLNLSENMSEGCWIEAPGEWGERVQSDHDWRWLPLGVRCTHVHTVTGEVRRTDEGWVPTALAGSGLAALAVGAALRVRRRLRGSPPTEPRPAAT